MNKKQFFLFIISLLVSFSGITKTTSTPTSSVIIDGTTLSDISKRVCYYEDKAYSYGAILKVGEHYLICKEANKFESNGALSWHRMEK